MKKERKSSVDQVRYNVNQVRKKNKRLNLRITFNENKYCLRSFKKLVMRSMTR